MFEPFSLFAAVLQERYVLEGHQHHHHHSHLYAEPSFTDTDSVLQVGTAYEDSFKQLKLLHFCEASFYAAATTKTDES